jgi:hypothetical protein
VKYNGYGLRREFADVAYHGMSLQTGMVRSVRWRYGKRHTTNAEVVFQRESTARAQMTRALNVGLDVEIAPMVLVAVKDYPG